MKYFKFDIFISLWLCIVALNLGYDPSNQIPIAQSMHKESHECCHTLFARVTKTINFPPKSMGVIAYALLVRQHQSIAHQKSRGDVTDVLLVQPQ